MFRLTALFLWMLLISHAAFAGQTVTLSLTAVVYGMSEYPENAVLQGGSNRKVPFGWLFYLVRYNNKNVLVDCGFDDPVAVRRFLKSHVRPAERLASLGLKPGQITDVIVTHRHFDHTGTLAEFPNARIIIQKKELESLVKNPVNRKLKSFLEGSANLRSFDGFYELDRILTVTNIGGHTEGSCVVYFRTEDRNVWLVGDEFYLPANAVKNIPSGTSFNREKNRKFVEFIHQSRDAYFTFHDPVLVTNLSGYRLLGTYQAFVK